MYNNCNCNRGEEATSMYYAVEKTSEPSEVFGQMESALKSLEYQLELLGRLEDKITPVLMDKMISSNDDSVKIGYRSVSQIGRLLEEFNNKISERNYIINNLIERAVL